MKPSKGLRKANLSPRTKALLEEVALSEQVRDYMMQQQQTRTRMRAHARTSLVCKEEAPCCSCEDWAPPAECCPTALVAPP